MWGGRCRPPRSRFAEKLRTPRGEAPAAVPPLRSFRLAVGFELAEELVQRRRRVVLRVFALVQQRERLTPAGAGELLERDAVLALAELLVVLRAEVVVRVGVFFQHP